MRSLGTASSDRTRHGFTVSTALTPSSAPKFCGAKVAESSGLVASRACAETMLASSCVGAEIWNRRIRAHRFHVSPSDNCPAGMIT